MITNWTAAHMLANISLLCIIICFYSLIYKQSYWTACHEGALGCKQGHGVSKASEQVAVWAGMRNVQLVFVNSISQLSAD